MLRQVEEGGRYRVVVLSRHVLNCNYVCHTALAMRIRSGNRIFYPFFFFLNDVGPGCSSSILLGVSVMRLDLLSMSLDFSDSSGG